MSTNPYAPPAAAVADVKPDEAQIEKPAQVVLAVRLLWLGVAINLVNSVLNAKFIGLGMRIPFMVISVAVSLAIYAWLIWKTSVGRNWARITLLVFAIIALPVAVISVPLIFKLYPLISIVSLLQNCVMVAALYLLFSKPGKYWFAPRF